MSANDLKNFRYLLGRLIAAERVPRRQLEGRLGVGHKNLEKLLDGTMETRLRHILEVAKWLGVRPGDLLDIGCPEITAAAHREVRDVLAPGRQAIETAVAAPRPPQEGGDELEAKIEKIVRRVLGRPDPDRPDEPPTEGGAEG